MTTLFNHLSSSSSAINARRTQFTVSSSEVALSTIEVCDVIAERCSAAHVRSKTKITCPVCNKLVVALIGAAGALDVFAPIQPLLGTAAIALLVWSLRRQARVASGVCSVPALETTR